MILSLTPLCFWPPLAVLTKRLRHVPTGVVTEAHSKLTCLFSYYYYYYYCYYCFVISYLCIFLLSVKFVKRRKIIIIIIIIGRLE
jgi:hypothetical protein